MTFDGIYLTFGIVILDYNPWVLYVSFMEEFQNTLQTLNITLNTSEKWHISNWSVYGSTHRDTCTQDL